MSEDYSVDECKMRIRIINHNMSFYTSGLQLWSSRLRDAEEHEIKLSEGKNK